MDTSNEYGKESLSAIRLMRSAWAFLLTTAIALGAAAQPASQVAPAPTAVPAAEPASEIVIPSVALEGLEPEIAKQLGELRMMAAESIAAGDTEASARQLSVLGRHYQAYEFFRAAAACYTASLDLQLDEVTAYLLALTLREIGELEEALKWFSIIASRQPNYEAARYYQALTLFDLGRFDESRATIPVDESGAAYAVLLGRLAMEVDQADTAIEYFERATVEAPEANRTFYLLGQAHRQLGNMDAARQALAKYGPVGARPSDPLWEDNERLRVGSMPFALSGRAAFAAGRYAEAASLFRKALDSKPDDPALMVNLASALAATGEKEEAKTLLRAAVAAEPDSGTAYFNLGVLLAAGDADRSQLEEALQFLDTSYALEPDDMLVRAQLAKLQARLGRPDKALGHLEALRDWPELSEDLALLELRLLVRAEEFAEASQSLDSSLAKLPASGLLAQAGARFFSSVPALEHRDGARSLDLAQRVYSATGDPRDAIAVGLAQGELGNCAEVVVWLEKAESSDLTPAQSDLLGRARDGVECRPR